MRTDLTLSLYVNNSCQHCNSNMVVVTLKMTTGLKDETNKWLVPWLVTTNVHGDTTRQVNISIDAPLPTVDALIIFVTALRVHSFSRIAVYRYVCASDIRPCKSEW
jgi:hypothetical protein